MQNEPTKRVLVVSMTYNRKDTTEQWLKELHIKAGYPFKHVVVDNGSTDGTREWLLESKMNFSLLPNEENVGIMKAWIQAYQYSIDNGFFPDYILKYDDDCEIKTPNILEKMVAFMEKTDDRYCIAPIDLNIDPEYVPQRLIEFKDVEKIEGETVRVVTHIGGMFALYPVKAFQKFLEVGGVERDQRRGEFLREQHRINSLYLCDLWVAHQGGGKSPNIDDYKF